MSQIMEKTLASLPKLLTQSLIGSKSAKPTNRQAPSQDVQSFMKFVHRARSKSHEAAIIQAEFSDLQQKLKQTDLTASSWLVRNSFTKAIFCHHLGYDVTFVAIYAVNLAQQGKGYDKRLGYLLSCLLLHPYHEMVMLMMATLIRDLKSSNMADNCIALLVAGELVVEENIPSILPEVIKKLSHPHELVREKALHCFRAFYQSAPGVLQPPLSMLDNFLVSRDPGVLSAVVNIFLILVTENPVKYLSLGQSFLHILHQINHRGFGTNYYYHMVPLPWLQINLLKILGQLGSVDSKLSEQIAPLLQALIERTKVTEPISLALLVESVATATIIYANEQLLHLCSRCIGKLLSSDAGNGMKYQGLGLLILLSRNKSSYAAQHQIAVIECLEDCDPAIQVRTTQLLHAMANRANAKAVCAKLFEQAKKTSDKLFVNDILYMIHDVAERLMIDVDWYVDTYLNILELTTDTNLEKKFIDLALSHLEQVSRKSQHMTEESVNNLITTLLHVLGKINSTKHVVILSLQLLGVLAPIIHEHFPAALFLTALERLFLAPEMQTSGQKISTIIESPVKQHIMDAEPNQHDDVINVQNSCLNTILKLVLGGCLDVIRVKDWLDKHKLRQLIQIPSIRCSLDELEEIIQHPDDLATRFEIMFYPQSANLDLSLSFLDEFVVHDLLHGKTTLKPSYIAISEQTAASPVVTPEQENQDQLVVSKTVASESAMDTSKASSSGSSKMSKSFSRVKHKWRDDEESEQFFIVNANGEDGGEIQEEEEEKKKKKQQRKEVLLRELFAGVDELHNDQSLVPFSARTAQKGMWDDEEDEDNHGTGASLSLNPFGISRKSRNIQQSRWHDDSSDNFSFDLDDNTDPNFISSKTEKVESPSEFMNTLYADFSLTSSSTQGEDTSNAVLYGPGIYDNFPGTNQNHAEATSQCQNTLPSIYSESVGVPSTPSGTSSSTLSLSTIDTLTDSDPEEVHS